MSSLAGKLLIYASAEALVIRPIAERQDDWKTVRIEYGSNRISKRQQIDDEQNAKPTIESYGIVGLLNLVSSSYLISITKRDEVAKIYGLPVYVIRDVALIPLFSQESAMRAISAVQRKLSQLSGVHSDQNEAIDSGDDVETSSLDDGEHSKSTANVNLAPPQRSKNHSSTTSQGTSRFGRLAQRWFDARSHQQSDQQRQKRQPNEDEFVDAEEMQPWHDNPEEDDNESIRGFQDQLAKNDQHQSTATPARQGKSVIESLTPRILRSTRLYFSSGGFYFSYEVDISSPLGSRQDRIVTGPLWRSFKPSHFWNRHLLTPLIDADCSEIVLPVMQGFVGQRQFFISKSTESDQVLIENITRETPGAEPKPKPEPDLEQTQTSADVSRLLLTLISRRSIRRAGLRYLRRGVDEEGNVANLVETEQILSRDSWGSDQKSYSLLQVRGSIPLFFSQSPYSFKPLPITFGSEDLNHGAIQKHFMNLGERYGRIQVASLVDKHGTEVTIGEAYERHMKQLNDEEKFTNSKAAFEWFDFHSACKGMKFENVSLLLSSLEANLNSFGWNVFLNDKLVQQQTGILRTNCMDCLDRTNVVQSSVGGWILQQQLSEIGVIIDLRNDANTQWFNTLWADNGDAISKQYAGTAALKGDFTRTRKRNWAGALSDFSLTLTRYYNNIFGDYFLQTEIDFFLGNAGPEIFDEFETDMKSKDYALDMQRVRHHAIDTCMKIVLEHPREKFISAWTLSCPSEPNTIRSSRFEDGVLLITTTALYFCRFDWTTEKVSSFERVNLMDITKLWQGTYITSALAPTHLDETKNVGFAFKYAIGPRSIVRTNTRSLQNEITAADENHGKDELEKQKAPEKDGSRLLAFKALPPKASAAKSHEEELPNLSETETIQRICLDMRYAMTYAEHNGQESDAGDTRSVPEIEKRDVISVAEAKKTTGYVESIGYSLKRLVWS